MSQEILADRLGVSINTLRGWMHYNRIPDVITGCEIAGVLEVTVEYLVTGKDRKDSKNLTGQIGAAKTALARIRKLARQIETETDRPHGLVV
jgi:transcriptional regulator with XRE-family HTH domain